MADVDVELREIRAEMHAMRVALERATSGGELHAYPPGPRITGWREVRGTHGMDYVKDPRGTAVPTWWT
jgi:hypothetical protein